ncbi:hypothetical protein DAMA08_021840 [Martiniozyma asiatica (nom. inval.)]|nr:hypothetical protein DAMA08_021840 [Martiniozyma asiatica]
MLILPDISKNLVSICDGIIENQQQASQNTNEYSKNGKKYKLTSNGQFIRVQGEAKHLLVSESYEDFKSNLSILSSYHILRSHGTLLERYRNLALAIIFTSREIELNKWYEPTSKVCNLESSQYNPQYVEKDALNYITNVSQASRREYIKLGCMILTATKINFFQTDHNVTSPTLEGYALRRLIAESCGDDALCNIDVYNSLRAFSHWCSIKGVFYKLEIPGLKIDSALIHNFKSFPTVPGWIRETIKGRYPAGCSKCSLIKKTLYLLDNSIYGQLLSIPADLNYKSFLKLCKDIELDPLKYHIRSGSLGLSIEPSIELHRIFNNANKWIMWISSVLHAIGEYRFAEGSKMITSNKIFKLNKVKDQKAYKETVKLVQEIRGMSDEAAVRSFGLSNSLSTQIGFT